MTYDLIIKNGNVVLTSGVTKCDIAINKGVIVAISESIDETAKKIVDAKEQYVMPGMIDTHFHACEPGRTEWEGFETATKALAAGGTTTYVDMPLNALPATVDKEALNLKIETAKGKNYIDYALLGGLVPKNLGNLKDLYDAGVVGYKCFISTCGSDMPDDFINVDDYTLYKGMKHLAELGAMLCIHAENASITDGLAKETRALGKTRPTDYVNTRPVFTEVESVNRVLILAKETGCKVHFMHISSIEAIEIITKARNEGIDVTVESCHHYLSITTEEFEALGPVAKCSPPLRDKKNQEALWKALLEGKIDILSSDHSPCPPEMKNHQNIFDAWGGISGCQNNVDLIFDEAVKKRNMHVEDLVKVLSTNPAKLFHLPNKGELSLGKDADIILVDPNQSYTLKQEDLYYRHKHSPYIGRTINCRVTKTILRGNIIYDVKECIVGLPIGKLIKNN